MIEKCGGDIKVTLLKNSICIIFWNKNNFDENKFNGNLMNIKIFKKINTTANLVQ